MNAPSELGIPFLAWQGSPREGGPRPTILACPYQGPAPTFLPPSPLVAKPCPCKARERGRWGGHLFNSSSASGLLAVLLVTLISPLQKGA